MPNRPTTSEGGVWGSYIPYLYELERQNEILRMPMAVFTESGELEDIHAWTPVEAGRLDELEADRAKLDKITPLLRTGPSFRMGQRIQDIIDG